MGDQGAAGQRVLVTGATGFVGRHLCRRLAADGYRVFGLSRQDRSEKTTAGWVSLDLRQPFDPGLLPDPIDVVMHLAANRRRSEMGPERLAEEVATNVEATARLYAWAASAGVRSIVHLSTADVVARGPHDRELPTEEAPVVEPTSHPYAVTKLWGEQVALRQRAAGRTVTILRPSNVYGPGQPERSLLVGLGRDLERGEPITLALPEGHRYAPLFVDDLVDVLAWAAAADEDHLLNVAGPPIFERDLLHVLGATLGLEVVLAPPDERPALGVAPCLDRLERALPERQRTSLNEGLKLTYGSAPGG